MKTIIDLFETKVNEYPNNIYLWEKYRGEYKGTTYKQTRNSVLQFAAALQTIGVEKGDRIALLSEGRNQWIISELGILYAGAINVPLSVKLDAQTDLKFRLNHSGAKMIIVSKNQAPKIEEIRKDIPALEKVIYLDIKEDTSENDLNFCDLVNDGKTFLRENRKKVEELYHSIQPDDLANISYTSGTTADPKGIMLTHNNYVSNVIQSNTLMEITPEWKTLGFLPWDHSFAHTALLYCFMYNGASIASLEMGKTPMETLKNISKNIKEIQPNVLISVPAVAKNFRKGIENGIKQKGEKTEKLFKHALKIAYKYNSNGHDKGKGIRILYKPLVSIYDKILFSKIRESFGGNLELFIGGGALLDIELQRFFYAIGIPMCQGYGLSEASPVISSNALHAIKFGSSGKIVKYLDLKILDEEGKELSNGQKGEIVIKGGNVMKGYWKNPEATAETIKNGWLHTGDMGYVDSDGFLYVLGRFKSLLIGNDGEKFSPEGIEEALVDQSKVIAQCMLYNEQNAYTVGLIVPNIQEINQILKNKGIESGSEEGNIESLKIIQDEVNKYRTSGEYANMFPERWLPSAIAILPEAFTEQNHLLNSMLKMVRRKVTEHYSKELDFLYTSEAKKIINENNKISIAKWNLH